MTIQNFEVQSTAHQGWITPQEQLERVAPSQLPNSLTNWYTALERIGALPDTIPPLPENIYEILGSTCPIYGDQLTVGETHSLYLIPPGTLKELEERVSAYGRKVFQSENHPLKFEFFLDPARVRHANVPNSQPQWVLISNDVLPGSRNQSSAKQVQMVEDLGARGETDYKVPTLREAIGAIFLHKVATEESLYQKGNEQNHYCYTYTRVKEMNSGYHLVVGFFSPSGLLVVSSYDHMNLREDSKEIGVAAVRKLSN